MRSSDFTHQASDGKTLFVYRFLPDEGTPVKAIVHLAHGMAEHAARYARVAEALTAAGYAVYVNDHRGHGKTASPEELGFFAEKDGFARVVGDLVELVAHEKKEHPDLPLLLIGHSMGSYMVQEFIIDHGREIAGAVISGSAGKPNLLASAGRLVARAERLRAGARGKSKLLGDLSFGAFNKQFAPTRTAFDWLSRDVAEVDKYVTDPLCGFDVTTSLWVDVLDALGSIARPERQARIPKDLPIYVFSGSEDPVSEKTKSLEQLLAAYRLAGVRDVAHRFYPGARHETLNETNRDEVTRDLITWLDAHTELRASAAPPA
jgi:alpha-beta hydrolase superfamily lysophospholipase